MVGKYRPAPVLEVCLAAREPAPTGAFTGAVKTVFGVCSVVAKRAH